MNVNSVNVFCIHIWKWKNETCWNCINEWGGQLRENDEGGESKIYRKQAWKYHTVPSIQLLYANYKEAFDGGGQWSGGERAIPFQQMVIKCECQLTLHTL
jgi:hypothetical protein